MPAPTGYTADDLDGLRAVAGIGGRLELDPWGNLIVSPASMPHEYALRALIGRIERAVGPDVDYFGNLGWRVPGGSGYLHVPDLLVVGAGTVSVAGDSLSAPPLLVVEVASPSTRSIDRSRKADDYLLGGAAIYLLVDLPGLAPVADPTVEARWLADGAWATTTHVDVLTLDVAGHQVVVDPGALVRA